MIKSYRKRPVVIQAVQWVGSNLREVTEFIDGQKVETPTEISRHKWYDYEELIRREGLIIKTLEGQHIATLNDFIIKGVRGEFYPCKPDIFRETYEEVNDE